VKGQKRSWRKHYESKCYMQVPRSTLFINFFGGFGYGGKWPYVVLVHSSHTHSHSHTHVHTCKHIHTHIVNDNHTVHIHTHPLQKWKKYHEESILSGSVMWNFSRALSSLPSFVGIGVKCKVPMVVRCAHTHTHTHTIYIYIYTYYQYKDRVSDNKVLNYKMERIKIILISME